MAALTLVAWALSEVMSGRAAYVHVGAIIGTMMVGNVFFVIMPAQRDLVGAIEAGREPDPSKPKNALLRSRHNNYLTLPVVCIMISNHFPSTYGNGLNWLILLALALMSVAVRHYFNTRHQSPAYVWALPFAVLALMVMAYVTAPASLSHDGPKVADAEVSQIMTKHCQSCHSAQPTFVGFATAPAGVMLDDLEQLRQHSARVYQQAVATHIMPLGNMTQMTEAERQQLGVWLATQTSE